MGCSQFWSRCSKSGLDAKDSAQNFHIHQRNKVGILKKLRGIPSPMESVWKCRKICGTWPGWESIPQCFKISPNGEGGALFKKKMGVGGFGKAGSGSWLNRGLGWRFVQPSFPQNSLKCGMALGRFPSQPDAAFPVNLRLNPSS